jgi:hypothetical protein
MKKTTFLALAVLFIVTWSCHTAFGQPPPLGPPDYKVDQTDLPVIVITDFVNVLVSFVPHNELECEPI